MGKSSLLVFLLFSVSLCVEVKNSRKILSGLSFNKPIPRELFKKDDIATNYYADNSSSNKPRELTLFDVSNSVYKLASDLNLKIVSQQHGLNNSEYTVKTPNERQLFLDVKRNENTYEFKIKNKEGKELNSLELPNRDYMKFEFYTFMKKNLDKIDERMLYSEEEINEVSNFTELLGKALEAHINDPNNNLSHIQFDIEFKPVDEFVSIAEVNGHEAFEVSITNNGETNELRISNKDEGENFWVFEDDHFEMIRSLTEQDSNESINRYFDDIAGLIIEKISLVLQNKPHIAEIAELLETYLAPFSLRPLNPEEMEDNKYLAIYVYEKLEGYNKLAEIQIVFVEGNNYQIRINKFGQHYTINLIAGQFETAIENIAGEIKATLTKAIKSYHDLEKLEEAVNNVLKSSGCDQSFIDEQSKDVYFNIFAIKFNDKEECPFFNADIKAEMFAYGYMQYLHIIFENNLLIEEFMISINDSFDDALTGSFDELVRELTEIRRKDEEEVISEDVDFEKLKKLAMDIAGSDYTCNGPDEDFECSKKMNNKTFVIMRLSKLSTEDEGTYFKINLFNPFNEENINDHGYINPEFTIPDKKNQKLAERAEIHLREFFSRYG